MRKIFIVFIFLLTTIYSPIVSAVTVGPAKIEYRADPGDVIEDTLILINEGNEKQTFYSVFEKFTEINGEKKFLPAEPTELANWFNLPKNATLEPGEQKRIPFTIEIPQNAPPGGHFAVIWWGNAPPESKHISIATRAGILIFLRVSGEVNQRGGFSSRSGGKEIGRGGVGLHRRCHLRLPARGPLRRYRGLC